MEKHGKVLTDKVLIVQNKDNNKLVAVSPLCLHRNCVVDWQEETQHFICPCHGSEFGTDGKVIKGPAKQGLKAFEVKVEENSFFIKPRIEN
nr:Rieske (2Fe-2S) protein [Dolichospermum sp. LEGE 00246]